MTNGWEFNDDPSEITFWIDGQEFGFGACVWGVPPVGFDLWYDDIAIGTSRAGPVK
jgi:hypothetical protein